MAVPMKYIGDAAVQKMLEKYGCPVPFHAVRMRFLGNIASPDENANRLTVIMKLWGDDGIPPFETEAEGKAFFSTLISLWNHMTRYQNGKTVRLHPLPKMRIVNDIKTAITIRREEVEGFLNGCSTEGLGSSLPDEFKSIISSMRNKLKYITEEELTIELTDFNSSPDGTKEYADLWIEYSKQLALFLTVVMDMGTACRGQMVQKTEVAGLAGAWLH